MAGRPLEVYGSWALALKVFTVSPAKATEAERWRCEDNATLLQSGESCEELRHRCEDKEARLVRLACPVTCGCADNMASPWYKADWRPILDVSRLCGAQVASQGCPTQCQAFLNSTCDEPSNETWGNLWDDYASRTSWLTATFWRLLLIFPLRGARVWSHIYFKVFDQSKPSL